MEIREHAILYALLCKEIFLHMEKEEAEKQIREITVAYGMKRGRRMAGNSTKKDINDFFINGEWKGKEGENISVLSFEKDRTISIVSRCAWYDTWKNYDLLEYGTYYCRYIDQSICEGYDSDFDLKVSEALGYGDEKCVFEWSEAANENVIKNTAKKHILPFDFHCRELYDCAYEMLPEDKRDEILKEVRSQLSSLCNGASF